MSVAKKFQSRGRDHGEVEIGNLGIARTCGPP
jgi:hypothetical protein